MTIPKLQVFAPGPNPGLHLFLSLSLLSLLRLTDRNVSLSPENRVLIPLLIWSYHQNRDHAVPGDDTDRKNDQLKTGKT